MYYRKGYGYEKGNIDNIKDFYSRFFSVFLCNELSGPRMSSADFGVVEKNVMKKMAAFHLEKQQGQAIKKNLSIDPSNYENIEYYKANDPMDVREIVIVQFKDASQGDAFKKAIQDRIDAQTHTFDGCFCC